MEDVDGKGVIDFSRVTVTFSADGKVGGRSGCNSYGGDYSVDGHRLTIGSLAMTEMACAPALMNQEDHFLSVLRDVTGWTLDAKGRIVLSTADGCNIAAIRD